MGKSNQLKSFWSSFLYFFKFNIPITVIMSMIVSVVVFIHCLIKGMMNLSDRFEPKAVGAIQKNELFKRMFSQYSGLDQNEARLIQLGSIVLIVVMLFIIGNEFNYLFNKQKLELFHSAYSNEKELLFSQTAGIFAIVTIQFIIGLALLVILYTAFSHEFDFVRILSCAFKFWAVCIAFCATFIFCAVSAGRYLRYLTSSILISALGIGFGFFLKMPENFLSGYVIPKNLIYSFFPINSMFHTDRNVYITEGVAMLAVTALFLFFAKVAHRAKMREDTVNVKPHRLLIILSVFSVNMLTMFALSSLWLLPVEDNPYVIIRISIAMTLLGTVLCELVLNKWKNIKAAVLQLALFITAATAFYVIVVTGGFGYSDVPQVDAVDSVSCTIYNGESMSETNRDITLHMKDPLAGSSTTIKLETPVAIDKVIKFHETQNKYFSKKRNETQGNLKVEYTMKNGSKITRQLFLQVYGNKTGRSELSDKMMTLTSMREYMLDISGLFGNTNGPVDVEEVFENQEVNRLFTVDFDIATTKKEGKFTTKIITDREDIKQIYIALYDDIVKGGSRNVNFGGDLIGNVTDYGGAMTKQTPMGMNLYSLSSTVSPQDTRELLSDENQMLAAVKLYDKYDFKGAGVIDKVIEKQQISFNKESYVYRALLDVKGAQDKYVSRQ